MLCIKGTILIILRSSSYKCFLFRSNSSQCWIYLALIDFLSLNVCILMMNLIKVIESIKFTNFHHTRTFINDEFPSQCSFLISQMDFLYSYRISWLWLIHIHEKIFNIVTKLYLFHYSDRSSYQRDNFHYSDPFSLQWQIEKILIRFGQSGEISSCRKIFITIVNFHHKNKLF